MNLDAAQELSDLKTYLKGVEEESHFDKDDFNKALRLFEEFECWESYYRLVTSFVGQIDDSHHSELFERACRKLGSHAYDLDKCAGMMVRAIKMLSLSYEDFFFNYLAKSLEIDNYRDEARVLEFLTRRELESSFLENCLERLAMLYDKKLHLDRQHYETRLRLLDVNPKNYKTHIYFKNRHQRNGDWDAVADSLKNLISISNHESEIERHAMELAFVSHCHLSASDVTVSVLDKYVGVTLDSNKLKYAALVELGLYTAALKILNEMGESVETQPETATILFHKGKLMFLGKQYEEAFDNYKKSYLEHNTSAAVLGMTRSAIAAGDKRLVKVILDFAMEFHDTNVREKADFLFNQL